ncbi:hypothetical protein OEZ60_11280 [Defluviimonas sp. WL0024]|uniref:Uncharacterized protein n=2 Tax=Albidovulum TaxID=205889 RepID=A0ABT3IYB7_9RHOB|nr:MULTISPECIES: hypothetical protein [Defluviimonas]MCU9848593.1 hypothetical protein [Defluviimonas sp. WL0024]MCW3780423.1 hypothetical protein [Defluviimonas salinarum]
MRALWVHACFLIAFTGHGASAEPWIGTDYDALFAVNARLVETQTAGDGSAVEVLKLEGGTVVSRRANGQITTMATDGNAVGCFVTILRSISAMDTACPLLFTEDEKGRLGVMRARALRHYAENIYPPQPYDAVDMAFRASVASDPISRTSSCESGMEENADAIGFARSFIASGTDAWLDGILAVPRLPADTPCL